MMQPPAIRVTARAIAGLCLALVFALFVRSYLRIELQARGFETHFANDLSYLIVPPILAVLLFPLLRAQGDFLLRLLRFDPLNARLLLSAIALGVLMRIAWWSQLVVSISFGVTRSNDPGAIVGPAFSFACPPLPAITLGFIVMAVLIPVTEETLHRGMLQSAFVHRGRAVAILVSATFFTLLHAPSSYVFVFLMGVVLGTQFWNTRTLWTTIVTHATYNGLVQFDWRCLHGAWDPAAAQLPLLLPGTIALIVLAASLSLALWLPGRTNVGAPGAPRR